MNANWIYITLFMYWCTNALSYWLKFDERLITKLNLVSLYHELIHTNQNTNLVIIILINSVILLF